MAEKAKRSKRGLGRLYKRDKKGKEHPAGSDVQGNYWLQYTVNGQRQRECLVDEAGKTITKLKDAEQIRLKIVAPLIGIDKKEALQTVKAKLEAASSETEREKRKNTPALTISNAWQEYKESQNRPKSGKSTLSRYKACLNAFCLWMKKNYPTVKEMRDVDTEQAEAYAHHLESKKLSPSSFNIYLNSLSMIWAVLEKKAKIQNNPFAWDRKTRTGIQRKNIKAEAEQRKKRALTVEEVNTVIEKAEGDYRTLCIILACTGQRLVDGTKLKWSEIDLNKNFITLTPTKTAKRTGKKVIIPILPQLRQELDSIMRSGTYVLPELVELYNKDKSIITKGIRVIFDKAGLNAHKETDLETGKAIVETGAHSFRHSFITIARMAGLPDPLIMKITGHKSEEMVDYYTDFSENIVAELAAKIPHALSSSTNRFLSDNTEAAIPEWAIEKLKKADDSNWKSIIDELINRKKS